MQQITNVLAIGDIQYYTTGIAAIHVNNYRLAKHILMLYFEIGYILFG